MIAKLLNKTRGFLGFIQTFADFIDAIREKRRTEVEMADAADSAALVMAVYESERTGSWVDIPAY